MSEVIVPDLAAVATHPSNTLLILQRLPLDRVRLMCWPASCEVSLDNFRGWDSQSCLDIVSRWY